MYIITYNDKLGERYVDWTRTAKVAGSNLLSALRF